MTKRSPFKYFKTSPEIIRLAVMLYVRFPLSLRNVEDLLHERGIEVSHETVRFWWQRFGPLFASEIRKRRIADLKTSRWQWHLDGHITKVNIVSLPGRFDLLRWIANLPPGVSKVGYRGEPS